MNNTQIQMLRQLCWVINIPSLYTTCGGMLLILPALMAGTTALVIQFTLVILQLHLHVFFRSGRITKSLVVGLLMVLMSLSVLGTLISFHRHFRGALVIKRNEAKRLELIREARLHVYEAFRNQAMKKETGLRNVRLQRNAFSSKQHNKSHTLQRLEAEFQKRLMLTKSLQNLAFGAKNVQDLETLGRRLDGGMTKSLSSSLGKIQSQLDQIPVSYAQMAMADMRENWIANLLLFLFAPFMDLLALCLGLLAPAQKEETAEGDLTSHTEALAIVQSIANELCNNPKKIVKSSEMNHALAKLKALLIDVYLRGSLPYADFFSRCRENHDCFGDALLEDLVRELFLRHVLVLKEESTFFSNQTAKNASLGHVFFEKKNLAAPLCDALDVMRLSLNGFVQAD